MLGLPTLSRAAIERGGSTVIEQRRPSMLLDDFLLITGLITGEVSRTTDGIINIIRHAREVTGIDRLYAVLGGLHLRFGSVVDLAGTADAGDPAAGSLCAERGGQYVHAGRRGMTAPPSAGVPGQPRRSWAIRSRRSANSVSPAWSTLPKLTRNIWRSSGRKAVPDMTSVS